MPLGLLGLIGGKAGEGRGQILEALKRPIITRTTEKFKYGKKGSASEGLVVEKTTKKVQISLADILVSIIAGGIIYVVANATIRDIIKDALDPLGLLGDVDLGPLADVITNAVDPAGLTDFINTVTVEDVRTMADIVKDAIDPFDWIDDSSSSPTWAINPGAGSD